MKTSTFLITLSIVIVSTFLSCQQKDQKQVKTLGVYNEEDCRLSKLVFDYENMDIEVEFTYQENNLISEIRRTVNEYKGRTSKITYNSQNQVEKFEIYHADTLSYFETIIWEQDRAIVSYFAFENDEWVNKNKISAKMNEYGEMIALDDFYADSSEVWSKKGTLYDYIWNKGNIDSIKNYIVENSMEHTIDLSKNKHYFLVNIDNVEYMVDAYNELEEYYTSSIEYSEHKNPLHHSAISNIIAPNDFNCSRNLPKLETTRYSNGDVVTKQYSYTINEKGYPIECLIKASIVSEGQSASTAFKINFEYTNCK